MSDSRHRVLKKPHHGADKTTRDRSQDAPAVGASGSTTLKRRGAINESKGSTSGAGDKGSERPPDANNSKPQSIRRFKYVINERNELSSMCVKVICLN